MYLSTSLDFKDCNASALFEQFRRI